MLLAFDRATDKLQTAKREAIFVTATQGAAMPTSRRRVEVVQLLGMAGASVAWLGWFQIAPALGFPTIGPAAMLNRVFVPKSDPGVWVGWLVLVLVLVAVAALYSLAAARGWIRPGPVSGLLFGLAGWAISGMVVMVVLGHISPPTPAPPAPPGPPLPTTPDPMHATFMMLHLGALAPVEALVAWLLFGAGVGAASFPTVREGEAPAVSGGPVQSGVAPATGHLTLAAALTLGGCISLLLASDAFGPALADAHIRVLATGQANSLPEGSVFVSVIELPQAAGATLGPHAHVPGFAYVVQGQETIPFRGEPTLELSSGQAGFMGGLVIHSHENRNDRVPAALLAAALVALGLILSVVSVMKITARRVSIAGLTGLLIVAGAVALWNPWANDWFFIAVRPAAARGGVMPLPNAARVYESPDLESLPPGPYTESLGLITVPAGELATVEKEPGPEMFLVLSGQAEVRLNGGSPVSLGTSQAALAQQGASVQVSNSSGEDLYLLTFSVVASGGSQ
jgi:quercetin dioxygenase-like cupin family protein